MLVQPYGRGQACCSALWPDKFVCPYKPGFSARIKHANGRYVQIGFLIKDGKMPNGPHVITSLADDILIGPTT